MYQTDVAPEFAAGFQITKQSSFLMGGPRRELETKNGASETKTHASETTNLASEFNLETDTGRKTHDTIPLNILVSGVGGFDPL